VTPVAARPCWVCAALVAGLLSGCVIVPTGVRFVRDDGTHRRVDGDLLAKLVEGRTTRPEVVAIIGRRDVELAGGRLWVYSWEVSSDWEVAWAFFGLSGAGAGVDTARFADKQ
jgi:hypothetical protein